MTAVSDSGLGYCFAVPTQIKHLPCQHLFIPAHVTGLLSLSHQCALPGKSRLPEEAAQKVKGVFVGVLVWFHALYLASWTHWCSPNHSGVKGILQEPSATRNVDILFSVPWNILILQAVGGGSRLPMGLTVTFCIWFCYFLASIL